MEHVPARRSIVAALLLGTAVWLGISGCSAGSSNKSATSGAARDGAGLPAADQATAAHATAGQDYTATNGQAAEGKVADPLGNAAAQQGAAADAPAKVETIERSIIYTGSITLRVTDVNDAASKATMIAAGAAGTVSGDQRSIDAGRSQATLILRIPSQRFSGVLDDLHKTLGKEESRSVQSQDVTEQVVDLDARIATARASVDRVRALMAKAQTLSDIVSLESELSRRESDLNSLLTRQNKLADLTALSTITVVLLGPEAKVTKPRPKNDTGFLAGLRNGWDAFVASLVVVLTIIGALLPWLIALGVPALLVIMALRRAARRKPQPAGVAPQPAGVAPQPEE